MQPQEQELKFQKGHIGDLRSALTQAQTQIDETGLIRLDNNQHLVNFSELLRLLPLLNDEGVSAILADVFGSELRNRHMIAGFLAESADNEEKREEARDYLADTEAIRCILLIPSSPKKKY